MIKKAAIAVCVLGLIALGFAVNDLRTDPKFRGTLAEHVAGIEPQPGTEGMIAMIAEVNDHRDGSVIGGWYGSLARQRGIWNGVGNEAEARRILKTATRYLSAGDTEDALELFHMIENEAETAALSPELKAELEEWIALSYLRLGEQQNCFFNPHASACIIPFDPEVIHKLREGSTKAIEYYEGKILPRDPDNFGAKWLLNIAYMTLGEYPAGVPEEHLIPMPGLVEDYDGPTFANVADFAGVDDMNLSGAAVVDDFDNDGLLDLFTTEWQKDGLIHLYLRNEDGTFREATEAAGLAGLSGGLNAIHADFDNDGFADIYVMRGAWNGMFGLVPNSLLKNNGDGTFRDVTVEAGLLEFEPTITSAFADLDNDGWLDLVVANERQSRARPHGVIRIFMNDQKGGFAALPDEQSFALACSPKGVTVGDYDADTAPDIYVSCQKERNMLMRNLAADNGGMVAFEDKAEEAGVAQPLFSFSTWFFDYDNDGLQDLFVANYDYTEQTGSAEAMGRVFAGVEGEYTRPALYRNLGGGRFEDVTAQAGLDAPSYTMGSNFGDFDNDGWLDMYWGTGAPPYDAVYPNTALLNQSGKGFLDITASSGLGHIQKGHGIAFADFDQDGDEDIFAQMGGAQSGDTFQNALFENRLQNRADANNWIKLKLEGKRSNRSAIGARIRVDVVMADGSKRSLYRTVNTGSSFGSSPLVRHIGLGKAESVSRVIVEWPTSGITQPLTGFDLNSAYRIVEGRTAFEKVPIDLRRFTRAEKPKMHDHSAM
ncbi:CRTAC1 family protein [Pontixanthobacter aestiaquae]|uniref:CRTAC1 family protein n=1 Tax=Pontixanthobacter aestiaquae TaxID=1509367 RepID=A0A844Z158_9SPHN|nr:CRTAC1 family protein [Pontixanthobacter aestiaquae]MDN3646552.1 CRTAC1 family protein [Pontixanthobacter aestiaquae]MXO82461.1 CRTAC1 family protein [Pontixanthobacter aestiaquae]